MDYQQKYLKYKNKYLALKNEQDGGLFTLKNGIHTFFTSINSLKSADLITQDQSGEVTIKKKIPDVKTINSRLNNNAYRIKNGENVLELVMDNSKRFDSYKNSLTEKITLNICATKLMDDSIVNISESQIEKYAARKNDKAVDDKAVDDDKKEELQNLFKDIEILKLHKSNNLPIEIKLNEKYNYQNQAHRENIARVLQNLLFLMENTTTVFDKSIDIDLSSWSANKILGLY
jgi:hypothetical protein